MDKLLKGQFFENTLRSLENAGRVINIDPNVMERLKYPKRCIIMSIPIRMDDYSVKVFTGYRVQHNSTLGPFKGGIRYHQNVTLSEVAALSTLMTFKNSLLGLPLGGGKGGVTVDPTQLSKTEKQNLTRRYASELSTFIGPRTDIPAPDVGTTPQTMAWFMDTYSQETGLAQPGCVTGKPVAIGGTEGRAGATGLGVVYCTERAWQKLGRKMSEVSIAIQGFGNVGQNAALYSHRLGSKVIAVSDVFGGFYDPEGLDIPGMIEYAKAYKSLKGYSKGAAISNEELLHLDVDSLLPCALEGVIHKDNFDKVKAKMIVEGANGPCTIEASKALREKNVHIIPDVLANGGGVVVSYFEWVQDATSSLFWGETEVNRRLETIMHKAFDTVWAFSEEKNLDMRLSAMSVSVKRLERATLMRGLYPR